MRPDEALALATRHASSLTEGAKVTSAKASSIASLWGGMGSVEEIKATTEAGGTFTFVAKVIKLPKNVSSVGDKRKADSYDVEANFYKGGHAVKLIAAGCRLPQPLGVDLGPPLTICMTKLGGRGYCSMGVEESSAALKWLATLHSAYWGNTRADAAVAAGLQPQGTYWYLPHSSNYLRPNY